MPFKRRQLVRRHHAFSNTLPMMNAVPSFSSQEGKKREITQPRVITKGGPQRFTLMRLCTRASPKPPEEGGGRREPHINVAL